MTITSLLLLLLSPTPACRLLGIPLTRDPAFTYFIAAALPDTVPATAGAGPSKYSFMPMSASTPPGLLPPPSLDAAVFGQVLALDRVGGFGEDKIQRYTSSGRREALLIPWGDQANCSPVLWGTSARWVVPGSVGFFVAQLRPDSEWEGGRPTLDVGAAWHQPYPDGEFLRYDREPDQSQMILTLSELWDLYETLPSPDSLQAHPHGAIEATREWVRAHPDQARRWPASRTVELLEHYAKRGQR